MSSRLPATALALLAGCTFLPVSMRQELPETSRNWSEAVPPGAGLGGSAGRLQDSLRPSLEWAALQLSKDAPYIERISFEALPDSSIALAIRMTDANGWNSHGRDSLALARLEWARWNARMSAHWPAHLAAAGLSPWHVRLRIAYRFHDAQRGRSDWRWDTLSGGLGDSLPTCLSRLR